MKKFIYIVLLVFCGVVLNAQVKPKAKEESPPEMKNTADSRYNPAVTQSLVDKVMHGDCVGKKFSVIIYLIQDSLMSLPTTIGLYTLPDLIDKLNATFSCICVSFEHCKTVIIPNYKYNEWTQVTSEYVMKNWYQENTINFYIPITIMGMFYDPNEYNYTFAAPPALPFPPAANTHTDAIVMQRPNLLTGSLLHVMGHFFGLPHTYHEINPAGAGTVIPGPPANTIPPVVSLEYVDRGALKNCYEHGDGFCDTEADPWPSVATGTNIIASGYQNSNTSRGLKDGHGEFYIPPADNAMSTYLSTRCGYTPEQYAYMAKFIRARRLYLH